MGKKKRRSFIQETRGDPFGGRKFRMKTGADRKQKVTPGARSKYWRGSYTRFDGVRVRGHWVKNPHYKGRKKRR